MAFKCKHVRTWDVKSNAKIHVSLGQIQSFQNRISLFGKFLFLDSKPEQKEQLVDK